MLIIGCFSVICISVITFLLFYVPLNRYVNNSISQAEYNNIQKKAVQFEDYFSQTVNCVVGIDNMVTVPVYELVESGDYWNTFLLKQNIDSYTSSLPFVATIRYSDANDDIISGRNENFSDYTVNIGSYKYCKLYLPNKIKWPSYMLFSYTNSRSNKDIDIYVNLNYISNLLFDENTFLTDKSGTVITASDNHLIGKNIYENFNLDKNSVLKGVSDSEYSAKCEKIENTDMNLITVTSKSAYRDQFLNVVFTSLLLTLPLTAVEMILIIMFIKTLSKPITDISKTIKYYFPNNENAFENEIAYINESIIETMDSSRKMQQELRQVIEKSRYSQAQAVYSQINPHFLFNTLDNLKWRSVLDLGVDNNIERICILLQKIIYECLQQSDMISTIQKEIEIASTYIQLMQIRYENTFGVVWDVDEEVKSALIIKLTLQPILENSIMHSFEPNKPGQKIEISIKKENSDSIVITIKDNGTGIEKERLKKIRSSLKNEEPDRKHIGIKNVHLRYRLLYGENYGIESVESDETGTAVKIRIPYHCSLHLKT